MAEKITIYDFIAWCMQTIDPAKLSALMNDYGYTDDSADSIMYALQNDAGFTEDFGSLLGEELRANDEELSRVVGGVSVENDTLTIGEWKNIARQNEISLATGKEADVKEAFNWNALISGVLGAATNIFGAVTNTANNLGGTTKTTTETSDSTSSSSIALYIIIGVVVIAVIAILWLSLSGQKK